MDKFYLCKQKCDSFPATQVATPGLSMAVKVVSVFRCQTQNGQNFLGNRNFSGDQATLSRQSGTINYRVSCLYTVWTKSWQQLRCTTVLHTLAGFAAFRASYSIRYSAVICSCLGGDTGVLLGAGISLSREAFLSSDP